MTVIPAGGLLLEREPRMLSTVSNTSVPATFWTGGDSYSRYVRCELPAKQLGAMVADPSLTPTAPLSQQRGRVAVWQLVSTRGRADLVAAQKRDGILTILESDDLYLNHVGTGWVEGLPAENERDVSSVELHRMVAGYVHRVVVPCPELAARYQEFAADVRVCRNAVDPDAWPDPVSSIDDRFRVGWVASGYHHAHRGIILDALNRIKRLYDDVDVYWVGVRTVKGAARKYRFRALPFTRDWAAYRDTVTRLGLDVGVAPLPDTEFARCKSDLKLLEYGMVGCYPVYSNVGPYVPWAGYPYGLSVDEPGGWFERLRWCCENRDTVRQLASLHRAEVLSKHTIQVRAADWEEAIK